MAYRAIQFDFGPESLTQFSADVTRRVQETMVDAGETLSKSIESSTPFDAWSLHMAFGMRNMQRWLGLGGFSADYDRLGIPPKKAYAPTTKAPPTATAAPTANTEAAPIPDQAAEDRAVHPANFGDGAAPTNAAPAKDDLQRIRGIGPAIAAKLAEQGITSFAEMAALKPDAVAALDKSLDLKGRIARDEWVEQAAALAGKV